MAHIFISASCEVVSANFWTLFSRADLSFSNAFSLSSNSEWDVFLRSLSSFGYNTYQFWFAGGSAAGFPGPSDIAVSWCPYIVQLHVCLCK